LKERVSDQVDAELKKFMSYRTNYADFVRNEIQAWFEKEFGVEKIPALEHRMTNVVRLQKSVVERSQSTKVETSADVLGAALLANEQLFRKPRAVMLKSSMLPAQILGLTRINQLLAHGGFSRADGRPYPALSRKLGEHAALNIQGD